MNDQLKRIVSIVIILCCFAGLSFAQQNTLTIDVKNANLEKIFELIEKQTSYKFSYRNIIIDKTSDINLKVIKLLFLRFYKPFFLKRAYNGISRQKNPL